MPEQLRFQNLNHRHIENSYTCMQAWNQPAFMLDGFLMCLDKLPIFMLDRINTRRLIRLDELHIFMLDGLNTKHLIRLDGLSVLKHKNGHTSELGKFISTPGRAS